MYYTEVIRTEYHHAINVHPKLGKKFDLHSNTAQVYQSIMFSLWTLTKKLNGTYISMDLYIKSIIKSSIPKAHRYLSIYQYTHCKLILSKEI